MFPSLGSNRIAKKLIKALILFSSLLTIGTTAVQLWAEYNRDVVAIDDRFVQVERSYIDAVSTNVWEADKARLQLQMNGITEFPDFKLALVRDQDGVTMAQTGSLGDETVIRHTYPLYFEFRNERRLIGELEVAASLTQVYTRVLDRVGLILLSNAIKTFLVSIFLFVLVNWLVTRHLDSMARYARKLDFALDVDVDDLVMARGRHGGTDELDDLAHALNAMKNKLYGSYADVRQLHDELEVRVRGRTRALLDEVKIRKKTAQKLAHSERRLRDIVEAGSDWVWEMGPDLRFTYLSEGSIRNTELKAEDVVGRHRLEFANDAADDVKWRNHMSDLENHRPFRDFEYPMKNSLGEISHVRVSGKPIFHNNGTFMGYRGISSNITTEVEARIQAHQAEEKLRVLSSAIEQNPSAVFITDNKGNIEFINDKFTRLTGFDDAEVIGKNPRFLKSSDTPPEVHKDIWTHITTGQEWRGEIKDTCKDGSSFWAYATIAPVKNQAGEITHFVATHENISERKVAEEKLREATRHAKVASRTKSEIMANMSHELRTPLNAIIGFSDTMLNGVFGPINNDRYEEYTRDIHDSGKHLLDLINDILDVSAIEAGKLDLHPEPLEIVPVVRSSLKLIGHRADASGVTLLHHFETNLPELLADQRRVKQILLNLLSNAVKFTPEGGRVSLSVSTAPDGGIRFEVEDTGIGMNKAGIETALTQFGQVDSKLARKYEGTGLGLPLTKSLVEAHKGTLDIRSRIGHGTTVVVHFPPNAQLPKMQTLLWSVLKTRIRPTRNQRFTKVLRRLNSDAFGVDDVVYILYL